MVQRLFEPVFMNKYLFDRHVKKIGYIHCKFKGWSASAVFNGTYRLPGYSKLLDKITLPYLFLFSDLCEIVFHRSPDNNLNLCLDMFILPHTYYVSRTLYVDDRDNEKDPPHSDGSFGAQTRN